MATWIDEPTRRTILKELGDARRLLGAAQRSCGNAQAAAHKAGSGTFRGDNVGRGADRVSGALSGSQRALAAAMDAVARIPSQPPETSR